MWVTYTSHFGPKKFDQVGRGVREGQNMAQNGPCLYVYFWLRSLPEAPKWVKDPRNGPQMAPLPAPDWFESISGVLEDLFSKLFNKSFFTPLLHFPQAPWCSCRTERKIYNWVWKGWRHIFTLQKKITWPTIPSPVRSSSNCRHWAASFIWKK